MNQLWIFSTGTELTRGYSRDTNSSEIAQLLLQNGFDVAGITLLPDNKDILIKNFEEKLQENVIGIIITGGLGPTDDDYTVDVLSEITKQKIIEDIESLEKIKLIVQRYKRINLEVARRQSRVLENAQVIKNQNGLAPGMILEYNKKIIVSLPGVPMEMRSMLPIVLEYLNTRFPKTYYEKHYFYIYNEPESEFQRNYKNIQSSLNATFNWGVSANPGYLKVFIENEDPQLKDNLNKFINSIKEFYKDRFLRKPIVETIQDIMIQNQKTLACCESCTGGYLSKILTDIPNSSQYFLGGIVSYSNELKIKFLNVKKETIQTYGAVSKECAEEMVIGLVNYIQSDYGISITGIAGPGGGSVEKPVGTVFIGIKTPQKVITHKIFYPSNRERIREYTVYTALYFLYKELENDFTK